MLAESFAVIAKNNNKSLVQDPASSEVIEDFAYRLVRRCKRP